MRSKGFVFICSLLIASFWYLGSSIKGHKLWGHYIWSDAEGYYMYLPAVFIYDGFENLPTRTPGEFTTYPGTNKIFTKYSCGVALMEVPFFLGAYAAYRLTGRIYQQYDATWYSGAILLAGCTYGVLGLALLYLVLLRHFDNRTYVLLTLGILLGGTNLLYYIIQAPGMSHVYSFFLVALLVYLTPRLYDGASLWVWLLAGLVFGLITLIRPTNALVALYPLSYGIVDGRGLLDRLGFLRKISLRRLLPAALAGAIVWLPQLLYWHYISGNWLLYSYGEEGFVNWNSPKIAEVLFSVLNGYFVYCPVMVVPVVTLFFMLRKNRLNGLAIFAIFWLETYLYASWWCWWYGGALGQRNYVDLLPLLVFPLAFFIQKMQSQALRKWQWAAWSFIGLAVFFTLRCTFLHDATWSTMGFSPKQYWEEVFLKVFFLN